MPLATIQLPRSSSPNRVLGLNEQHPLRAGLVFLAYMVDGVWYDVLSKQFVTHPGTRRIRHSIDGAGDGSVHGIGSGGAGGQFANQTGLDRVAGAFSLFAEGSLEVNTSDSSVVRSFESNNGRGFGINLDDTNVSTNDFYAFVDNGVRASSTVNALGTNSEQFTHRVMITGDGTNIRLYAKGALNNTTGSAFLPTADVGRRTTMLGSNGTQGSASASIVAAWDRLQTVDAYLQLFVNPWQLLEPDEFFVWISPPVVVPPIAGEVGSRRNRPGRGPYSRDAFLRPEAVIFGRNIWRTDVAEPATATDAATGVNTIAQAVAEAVSATDSGSSALAFPATAADSVTAADGSATSAFAVFAADAITPTDIAATVSAFFKEIENLGDRRNRPGRGPYSLGAYFRPDTPVVSGRTVWGASAADAAPSIGDSSDTIPTMGASDAVAATDSATGLLVMLVAAADSAAPGANASSDSGADLQATDGVNADEAASSQMTMPLLVLDFVTPDDSATPQFVFTASALDGAAVSSGATGYMVVTSAALDALSTLDSASSFGARDVLAEDAPALSDAAIALLLSLIGSPDRTVYIAAEGRWLRVSPGTLN